MNEWDTYRLQDFVPFTAEVYLRLLERVGEGLWPLQVFALVVAGAVLWLSLSGRVRIALILLAPWWVVTGWIFFFKYYVTLNWAGRYIGWLFIAEAAILLAIAFFGVGRAPSVSSPKWQSVPVLLGVLIALLGLIGIPVIAPWLGYSWYRAEVFGLHADPTAMLTLGVVLIAVKRAARWIATFIPLVWLLLSGMTLSVLGAGWGLGIFFAAAVGILGVLWRD